MLFKSIALLSFSLFAFSCSTTYEISGKKEIAPAAKADVKIEEVSYGNQKVKLEVRHLAEPARLIDGANTYIVWVEPTESNGLPQNMGALDVNKNLSGQIEMLVSYTNYDLFITPEKDRSVGFPSGPRIFSQKVRGTTVM
ncbi:MAG: hypothetical protein M9962_09260 [Oligoflexia bacterium]|nr:hypothetical protein [Oligoflexia bacterium]